MKDIHPKNCRWVIFTDINHPEKYIRCKSTVKTDKKILIEGVEYSHVTLDTSYLSHPFYTGGKSGNLKARQIDKFNKRFSKTFNKKETEEKKS